MAYNYVFGGGNCYLKKVQKCFGILKISICPIVLKTIFTPQKTIQNVTN